MMPTVQDVCRHVRSKNAGPFWVTFDLFFRNREDFHRYARHPALGPPPSSACSGPTRRWSSSSPSKTSTWSRFPACGRPPSGGREERDMHSGQMFVRLLDVQLD
jgi:hypothetical protein